jgi:hypothetical protein
MQSYQESNLLIKMQLFMSPLYIAGLLGFFFPWVYAFVPVHASEFCMCSFYVKQANGSRNYPFLKNYMLAPILEINQLSFYAINFAFMLALIVMAYRIRHINDNTHISKECSVIVLWWMVCSFLQYFIWTALKLSICKENLLSSVGTLSVTYYSQLVKDCVTMAITIYYQTVVNKEQNLQQVVQTGGFDNTQAIMDFDILLESVYPHKQFTVFLRKRRADLLPYLQVIRKAKLLRAKQTEMDELII